MKIILEVLQNGLLIFVFQHFIECSEMQEDENHFIFEIVFQYRNTFHQQIFFSYLQLDFYHQLYDQCVTPYHFHSY